MGKKNKWKNFQKLIATISLMVFLFIGGCAEKGEDKLSIPPTPTEQSEVVNPEKEIPQSESPKSESLGAGQPKPTEIEPQTTDQTVQKIDTNLAPEDAAKLNEILNHSAKYINEVANGHLLGDPDLALNANKVCVQEDYKTFQESFDVEELKELDEAFETAIYNMEADCSKDGRMIYRDNYKEKLRQVLKIFEKYTS